MAQSHALERSEVNLGGTALPVIRRGRHAWVFRGSRPVAVPAALLRAPRFLEWVIRDHLQAAPDKTLAVTVIPQMGCNAACGYCIQNVRTTDAGVERVKAAWMSDHVMDDVARFIEGRRVACQRDSVTLEIFGGEPLLNPSRCYRLLERIAHVSHASITTNAVLLTPTIARNLTDLGVTSAQVTFDGGQQDHDRIRVLAKNGSGTYNTIVGNLAAIDTLDVLPDRQLRVNVTQSNLHGLPGLVDDLAHTLTPKNWLLYFALVDNNGIGWGDVLQLGQDVNDALVQLARQAAAKGFIPPTAPNDDDCGFCGVPFGDGGMVVNADGLLYSCWDTAGFPHMSVGDVWQGYVSAASSADKWVQCGYRSANQGIQPERGDTNSELAWVLRELGVMRPQR